MLPTGEQNLSTWSKKYVEDNAFVKKWPLVGSSGEKNSTAKSPWVWSGSGNLG